MGNQRIQLTPIKRKVPALVLFMAAIIIPCCAIADTQINISGTIKASPCKIDVPSGGVNVDLGQDIQASTLSDAGSATEWKPFTIVLTECPTTTSAAIMKLDGMPDEFENTMFANTGSAGQVQIEVQSQAGAPLYHGVEITQPVSTNAQGTAFEMKARAYSSQGKATPGSIVGTVQATFTYQ